MKVSSQDFEEMVREAIASIPHDFQPYLEDIEFVVAKRSPRGLLGLYEGAGALGAGDFPARVTVFKEAHEADADTWEELAAEVRRTVLHEIGHHFDMGEDELPY